ncbi:MAG: hypothetical protein HY852_05605 [Bradyrhizobium sp.]|uniref:hypothetical protein n=1 Tax=Bradyrhizobium sp. TaxID=376 RepID=UPI0025C5E6A4|nr:hypothetical protein [Bradyrhizobium sp.]MBI5261279.1 hypothetical protein [Bradyrhizobium sp.]
MTDPKLYSLANQRGLIIALLCVHIASCSLSLVYVAHYYEYIGVFTFDRSQLPAAILLVSLFALVSLGFVICKFSFGYLIGFYFYTMVLGYLWLANFSRLEYNHWAGAISAIASILAFLAPALLVTSPFRRTIALSKRQLDWLVYSLIVIAVCVIAYGARYSFRIVGIADIYRFRNELEFPTILRYLIGTTSNALLPFAFAISFVRGKFLLAGAALFLLLLFYPVTLSKLTIFGPIWLLFLAVLCRVHSPRITVLLSLLIPICLGVVLVALFSSGVAPYQVLFSYFSAVNFRMVAVPSAVLELYSDFFSTHELTHFCQMNFLKYLLTCPYSEQLSVVMLNTYNLGHANASLFATEGIASLGLGLAPLSAAGCGLVIAISNRASAGLPASFVILSSGMITHVLVNVPLATTLLSNGAALLFLLWYVVPRSIFDSTEADQPLPESEQARRGS